MLPLINSLTAAHRAAWFFQQRDRRHDLAGGAVSALITIAGEKAGLHGVHRLGRAQPSMVVISSPSCITARLSRRAPSAIHVHRARATLAVVAALLCTGEDDALANAIEQCGSRIDAKLAVHAIDAQDDRDRSLDIRFIGDYRAAVVPLDRDIRAHWQVSSDYYRCGTPSSQ